MEKVKKIYEHREALVSDDIIAASDDEIDEAIPEARVGTMIYNAAMTVFRQKGLDSKWVPIATGGGGKDGKSAYEIAKELHPEIGSEEEWIASLQGAPGVAGKDGAAGKNGKSVTGLTLKIGEDGRVTGGTIAFDDQTSAEITVQTE